MELSYLNKKQQMSVLFLKKKKKSDLIRSELQRDSYYRIMEYRFQRGENNAAKESR